MKKNEEELGVKIGTQKESRWNQVREASSEAIIKGEMEIEINAEIKALAERKIAEEKDKLK